MAVQHGERGAVSLLAPPQSGKALKTPDQTNLIGQTLWWTLTIHQSFSDRNSDDHRFQTFRDKNQRWTAELEMSWDAADDSLNQDKLWEAIMPGEFDDALADAQRVQVNLYVSENRCYYGAAYIERADVHAPFDGPVTARFLLRGSGRLKYQAASGGS